MREVSGQAARGGGYSVSKGSARRPGSGYADNWTRIFREQDTQAQTDQPVLAEIPVEPPGGTRAKGDGQRPESRGIASA